jgi:hypothetical protein
VRDAFQLPPQAEVIWPPRSGLQAGSVIDAGLRVIASDDRSAIHQPIRGDVIKVLLSPEQLQPPNGFWMWRTFLSNPERLTIEVRLADSKSSGWVLQRKP